MPIVTTRADARLAITATRVAWLVGGSGSVVVGEVVGVGVGVGGCGEVVVAAKKLVLDQAC